MSTVDRDATPDEMNGVKGVDARTSAIVLPGNRKRRLTSNDAGTTSDIVENKPAASNHVAGKSISGVSKGIAENVTQFSKDVTEKGRTAKRIGGRNATVESIDDFLKDSTTNGVGSALSNPGRRDDVARQVSPVLRDNPREGEGGGGKRLNSLRLYSKNSQNDSDLPVAQKSDKPLCGYTIPKLSSTPSLPHTHTTQTTSSAKSKNPPHSARILKRTPSSRQPSAPRCKRKNGNTALKRCNRSKINKPDHQVHSQHKQESVTSAEKKTELHSVVPRVSPPASKRVVHTFKLDNSKRLTQFTPVESLACSEACQFDDHQLGFRDTTDPKVDTPNVPNPKDALNAFDPKLEARGKFSFDSKDDFDAFDPDLNANSNDDHNSPNKLDLSLEDHPPSPSTDRPSLSPPSNSHPLDGHTSDSAITQTDSNKTDTDSKSTQIDPKLIIRRTLDRFFDKGTITNRQYKRILERATRRVQEGKARTPYVDERRVVRLVSDYVQAYKTILHT